MNKYVKPWKGLGSANGPVKIALSETVDTATAGHFICQIRQSFDGRLDGSGGRKESAFVGSVGGVKVWKRVIL